MGDLVISPAALAAISGLLSALVAVVAKLYHSMITQYELRLAEHKAELLKQDELLRDNTAAIRALSVVIESWTPDAQKRRAGR
jgi:hypothetical protein